MSDEPEVVEEDELPVEERARRGAHAAAVAQAAYILYVDQCEEMDIEPKESLKDLSDKARKRWLKKGEALIGDALLTGRAPNKLETAHAPAPARNGQPQSDPDALAALAGGAKVDEQRPADDTYVDEEGNWTPPVGAVLLKVTRGNLVLPLKIPVDVCAPDVTGGAGMVLEQVKDAFLRAQQQGNPSMPLRPQDDYALHLKNGVVLTKTMRLRLSDFAEVLEEDPSVPGTTAELVDVGGQARTTPTAQAQPAGLGNPVVIGTGDDRGRVLGRPAGGGQGQAAPAQAQPSQGTARVADPQQGQGHART